MFFLNIDHVLPLAKMGRGTQVSVLWGPFVVWSMSSVWRVLDLWKFYGFPRPLWVLFHEIIMNTSWKVSTSFSSGIFCIQTPLRSSIYTLYNLTVPLYLAWFRINNPTWASLSLSGLLILLRNWGWEKKNKHLDCITSWAQRRNLVFEFGITFALLPHNPCWWLPAQGYIWPQHPGLD